MAVTGPRRSPWITFAAVVAVVTIGGALTARRARRARAAVPVLSAPRSLVSPEAVTSAPSSPPRPPAPVGRSSLVRRLVWMAVAVVVAVAGISVAVTRVDRTASPALSPAQGTYLAPVFRDPPLIVTPQPVYTPPTFSPPASPTSPPSPSPTGPRPGGILTVGSSVVMRGDSGEEMLLTVVRVDNPAPAQDPDRSGVPALRPAIGTRLVAVVVRIENVGGVSFLGDPESHSWLMDAQGRAYRRDVAMTDSRNQHQPTRIDPGRLDTRTVIFEVKGSAALTRYRLSLRLGVAARTQDWRLA